jgi:hypothetical protein
MYDPTTRRLSKYQGPVLAPGWRDIPPGRPGFVETAGPGAVYACWSLILETERALAARPPDPWEGPRPPEGPPWPQGILYLRHGHTDGPGWPCACPAPPKETPQIKDLLHIERGHALHHQPPLTPEQRQQLEHHRRRMHEWKEGHQGHVTWWPVAAWAAHGMTPPPVAMLPSPRSET